MIYRRFNLKNQFKLFVKASIEKNPQAVNSSNHDLYSANNQPDSVRGRLYSGYYKPQDRAKRIVIYWKLKTILPKNNFKNTVQFQKPILDFFRSIQSHNLF